MPALADRTCPCRSGRLYKRCCQPFHGGRPPPTATALMRSRYAAYALGLVDYILDTTDPTGPRAQPDRALWAEEVARFGRTTRFLTLRILDEAESGDEARVSFHAGLQQNGADASFSERSRFRRVDGRWLYHSGERLG